MNNISIHSFLFLALLALKTGFSVAGPPQGSSSASAGESAENLPENFFVMQSNAEYDGMLAKSPFRKQKMNVSAALNVSLFMLGLTAVSFLLMYCFATIKSFDSHTSSRLLAGADKKDACGASGEVIPPYKLAATLATTVASKFGDESGPFTDTVTEGDIAVGVVYETTAPTTAARRKCVQECKKWIGGLTTRNALAAAIKDVRETGGEKEVRRGASVGQGEVKLYVRIAEQRPEAPKPPKPSLSAWFDDDGDDDLQKQLDSLKLKGSKGDAGAAEGKPAAAKEAATAPTPEPRTKTEDAGAAAAAAAAAPEEAPLEKIQGRPRGIADTDTDQEISDAVNSWRQKLIKRRKFRTTAGSDEN